MTGGSRRLSRLTAILAQLLPSCAALGTRVPRSATRYTTWTLVNIDTFCQSSANNKFQSLPQPPVHKSLGCANLTTRNTRKLARTQVWTSLCGSIYKKLAQGRSDLENKWETMRKREGRRWGGEEWWREDLRRKSGTISRVRLHIHSQMCNHLKWAAFCCSWEEIHGHAEETLKLPIVHQQKTRTYMWSRDVGLCDVCSGQLPGVPFPETDWHTRKKLQTGGWDKLWNFAVCTRLAECVIIYRCSVKMSG